MSLQPLIAIIDDDGAILTGLSSLLRSESFRVHTYQSAEAFLDNVGTALPDCVLTDVQMPSINGLELQSELGRRYASLPVIFMTAFPDETVQARALAAGALAFLHKPFEAQTMLDLLANAIRSSKTDRGML